MPLQHSVHIIVYTEGYLLFIQWPKVYRNATWIFGPSLLYQPKFDWIQKLPHQSCRHNLNRLGPFLKSPETLRAIFGCHHSLCILRIEKIKVVKLHSHFFFVSLKSCQKIGFPKQAVGSFTNGFSGPKSFRDFRETGPRSSFFFSACLPYFEAVHAPNAIPG